MRVCDYIAQRLSELGVKQVYGLVGGSTAGLNDGFISSPDIEFVAFHHEQGAGHAAVGAARTNNRLAVCNVTAGCGVTNAMTSLLNAWEESALVLFLSGNTGMTNQAKYINQDKGINIRKYGIQDLDVLQTVAHLCKYAVAIERADRVPYELEQAIWLAQQGRPGPVWIDIPGNLQFAELPAAYEQFLPPKQAQNISNQAFYLALDEVSKSQRPIIVAGNGINLGSARAQFLEFVDKYKIPFVTTFLSRDLIEYDHPQNLGMMGIKGNRCANFAMQNSDCLLILGCSMNVTHIGYDAKSFSPASTKIMIDIDSNELGKDIFKVDMPIVGDVKDFLFTATSYAAPKSHEFWSLVCKRWKDKWPVYNPELHRPDTDGLNLYEITESINRNMQPRDCFIVDAGQPCYILSTNGKYKTDCRYMAQAAQGDMGYAIPASVGAHFANPDLNLVLVIGEGSFYTNMQELAVIKQHNIPVKIFVINNDGYMSIKQTQDKFFGGRQWGVSQSTGVYFADIEKVAAAFEIPYHRISSNAELDQHMTHHLNYRSGPVIVEFLSQHQLDVQPAQAILPDGRQGGLHEMSPFLSQEELTKEMLIQI
jgi:acetolactate synthase-1/2/3 large subunit